MAVTSTASSVWRGNLADGSGTVSSNSSDNLRELPTSWNARTVAHEGKTSPEELLAAAHASCFSMALSANLARAGFTADELSVTAEVNADRVDEKWTVISSHLTVNGRVPGASESDFQSAAAAAKDGCPISRALAGNVELSVSATLES
jgi:osmotically inducible protein OsmC